MTRIGTHNSLTFLPLKTWWFYPFNWIAKCQSKSIEEQYEQYGIRDFDFRIRFKDDNTPYICHGIMKYKGNIEDYFQYLNDKGGCTIRFILEKTKEKEDGQEDLFVKYVEYVISKYPNITFWQFTRKYDWKQLYQSPYDESYYDQDISSVKGLGLWPWFYAKRHNKDAKSDKELLLLDYIQIQ